MKKSFIAAIFVLFAASCSLCAYAIIDTPPSKDFTTDPNPDGGGDVRVNCYCGSSSYNGCKSSNDGNICAQSASGGNIVCGSFNGNC